MINPGIGLVNGYRYGSGKGAAARGQKDHDDDQYIAQPLFTSIWHESTSVTNIVDGFIIFQFRFKCNSFMKIPILSLHIHAQRSAFLRKKALFAPV